MEGQALAGSAEEGRVIVFVDESGLSELYSPRIPGYLSSQIHAASGMDIQACRTSAGVA